MPLGAYLEIGGTRVFAGALDWPGWCRSGRDPGGALETLVVYGPRYARVLRGTRLRFDAPTSTDELAVRERLRGDATTDFGAPSIAPRSDRAPLDGEDLERAIRILRACWRTLDRTVEGARGVPLAKGPRGGGRQLDAIVGHVVGAEAGYVRMIAGTPPRAADDPAAARAVRRAVIEAMERAAGVGLPARGPRGGKRWTVRYFVRRAAWHVLDHAWEIEDRA
ncbi:MAG TPA: hypothetical protein VFQ40_09275 [Actinomycetota bacterium]|nr:hypothetical protein [Actinomycetota bacterium]